MHRRGRRAVPVAGLVVLACSALAAQAFVLPSPGGSSLRSASGSSMISPIRPSRRLAPLGVTQGFPRGGREGEGEHHQQQHQQEQRRQQHQEEAEEGLYFDWMHNWRVHYVQAGEKDKPPLLLW